MLTLVLAHHYDLTPTTANTAFADALAALRAEDDALFDGEDIALINTCGEQRLGKTAPADTTPPVVNGVLSPAAPDGANGWYRTAPTVTWSDLRPASRRTSTTAASEGADPADTPGRTHHLHGDERRRHDVQVAELQEGRHRRPRWPRRSAPRRRWVTP